MCTVFAQVDSPDTYFFLLSLSFIRTEAKEKRFKAVLCII